MLLCRPPSGPELQSLTGWSAGTLRRLEAAGKLQEQRLDVLVDSSGRPEGDDGMDPIERLADPCDSPDKVLRDPIEDRHVLGGIPPWQDDCISLCAFLQVKPANGGGAPNPTRINTCTFVDTSRYLFAIGMVAGTLRQGASGFCKAWSA